jgi:sec-independent protein translocase protein TatA
VEAAKTMTGSVGDLLMLIPSGMEWVFLVAVIVVVFFGVKKVPQLARSFGKAQGEYQKARMEAQKELDEIKRQTSAGRKDDGT